MDRGLKQARSRAVGRGMGFLERVSQSPRLRDRFGSGLLYCCSFMAVTAAEAGLRARARRLALTGFDSWRRANPLNETGIDSSLVVHFIQAYDAASRLGLRFPRAVSILRRAARAHSPEELLWFDPRREAPPADIPESCDCGALNPRGARRCGSCAARLSRMTAMRAWYLCFTSAYCAGKLGVPLGPRYADAMAWLPYMRRYRSPRQSVPAFYDSVYAITHVVYTLNDYGRFLLEPEWLPWEYDFLARHLNDAVALDDPDMVGEFLDTLRAFGLPAGEPGLRHATEYLIDSQNPDGSWGAREGTIDYRRFHATWAAIDGLREFRWTRAGVSFPSILPRLKIWACVS
jgi:hypothetical protein